MPRTKQRATAGEPNGSLASRIVGQMKKDKLISEVVKMGNGSLLSDVPYYVSTGVATLDYAIGRPGIPASKLTTIFGREGSGKSTLSYSLLAETQKMGGIGVLIDSEQRFTPDRARRIGLNPDELIIVDGATTEQAFDSIEKIVDAIRADSIDIPVTIVYDSLAGSVPEKRMAAEVGDVQVANVARLASALIPRIKLKIARMGCALVIVNQVRQRVNMGGDPRTGMYNERMKVMGQRYAMLAEMTLIFESALMIYVNAIATNGEDKAKPTGIRSRFVIRKCGISPHEMWQAEADIDYMTGFDKEAAMFDLLEELGYIKHSSGGWYMMRGDLDTEFDGADKKFQRKDFAALMESRPEMDLALAAAPESWQKKVAREEDETVVSQGSAPDIGSGVGRGTEDESPALE